MFSAFRRFGVSAGAVVPPRKGRPYDVPVTSAAQPTSRRPAGRGFVLLVLAVLAGVLGMHALSPGPAPAASHHAEARHGTGMGGGMGAGLGTAAEHAATVSDPDGSCSHPDGGSGHLEHADATCAAAGIVSAYAPPALTAALGDATVVPPPAGTAPRSALSSRAPPDLAELQLLRI